VDGDALLVQAQPVRLGADHAVVLADARETRAVHAERPRLATLTGTARGFLTLAAEVRPTTPAEPLIDDATPPEILFRSREGDAACPVVVAETGLLAAGAGAARADDLVDRARSPIRDLETIVDRRECAPIARAVLLRQTTRLTAADRLRPRLRTDGAVVLP